MIMWIMAIGAVIGGIDYILSNRFGLGEKFEQGFHLLGPTAFSMVGIISLAPLAAKGMKICLVPLYDWINLDPGMLGSVLAIDMGGYQLAKELAHNANIGLFSGILVAATFGCTISFTIPVGMGMLTKEEGRGYAKGILYGLVAMPVALIVGGLYCKLTFLQTLWQCLPLLIMCALLGAGIFFCRERMVRGFQIFAKGIQIIATIGLILGAFSYMTGFVIVKDMTPIEEGMKVASSIAVVMLGSLPIAELLTRALRKPFQILGNKVGLSGECFTTILISMVSSVPAIVMSKNLSERERAVVASYIVCGTAIIAAHLGFTYSVEPQLIGAIIVMKLVGGVLGTLICILSTKKK